METWKFGHIKLEGFQNEPQEGYIEVTPDAGVPFRRERFSDIQDIVRGNFTLTKDEYIDFMSWYKNDIRQGSIPFKMYDCRIETERVARIVGKPTYTTNSIYFDLAITLMFESGDFVLEAALIADEDYALVGNGNILVMGTVVNL